MAAVTGEEVKSQCLQPHASCLHICRFTGLATLTASLGLQTRRAEARADLPCQCSDARAHLPADLGSLHKPQTIKADNPTLKTPTSRCEETRHPPLRAGSAPVARVDESIHLRFLHLQLHQLLDCPRMGQAWGLDYSAGFLEGRYRRESQ